MFRIRVERTLDAPADQVFDAIADHESYTQFRGVEKATVVEAGTHEKNGEGALRHMGGSGMELFERITLFERPTRMHYRIERSRPVRIDHLKGEITIYPEGNRSRVVWESEGKIRVPLLGLFMDKRAEKESARLFGGILRGIGERLARTPPKAGQAAEG